MAYTEKTCANAGCGKVFIGKANKRFCCDTCRWSEHVRQKTGAAVGADGAAQLSARGKRNRAKGARAEREVCHIINAITGGEVKRELSQTRDSGSDVRWGPFLLEVKFHQNVAMPAWQKQASANAAQAGMVPAVVYRRPEEQFWVSLPFDAFVTMFETLRRAAEAQLADGKPGD